MDRRRPRAIPPTRCCLTKKRSWLVSFNLIQNAQPEAPGWAFLFCGERTACPLCAGASRVRQSDAAATCGVLAIAPSRSRKSIPSTGGLEIAKLFFG